MDFYILTLTDKHEWNDFLFKLPDERRDVYYTPEYYSLYENYGDGKTMCFVFRKNENIALYPFLINSVNELGYDLDKEYYDIQGAYGYNGVISSTFDENFIKDFYKVFNEFCHEQNIIAEFTRFHPIYQNHLFSKENLNIVFDRKTVFLELVNKQHSDIFKNYQTTTRKQIKRARERYNIEVKIIKKAIDYVDVFYDIYYETMQRVNSDKYLFFNKNYFSELVQNVDNIMLIAYYQGVPIASIIALLGSMIVHGHLGGARTEFLHLSAYSLLYDEMIKYGLNNGYRYFYCGGGTSNNPDDPLLKFKLHFSETTLDFYIGKKIHNQKVYDLVVQQWERRFPEKVEKYKNYILKYRY